MEKINDPNGQSIIKKIAIVGPESTGKSTLAKALATELNTVWVPEFARTYINNLDRPYDEYDLAAIVKGQLEEEQKLLPLANEFLISDTELLVIKIWSEVKYGHCDPWILEQYARQHYHLHLLTYPDIAWQYDPQREHPEAQEELLQLYIEEFQTRQINFVRIKGDHQNRLKTALEAIALLK